MPDNDTEGVNHRVECPDCGKRYSAESLPSECPSVSCDIILGPANEVEPVQEGQIRVYCPRCDFEVDIDTDEWTSPVEYAQARSMLHRSQSGGHWSQIVSPAPDYERQDGGMRLCGELNSEDELQSWLKSFFEDKGWTAIREASPFHTDYKADLIVNHEDYGWFGIETKYFEGDGGAKAAEAHHQITRKYRGRKYVGGNRIDMWAVCPYFWGFNSPNYPGKRRQQGHRATFMREFFCRHGIGYIDLNRTTLLMDFALSTPLAKVPVGGSHTDKYEDGVGVEELREHIQGKLERYDYR